MLSAQRLALLEAYSGGTIRAKLLDPEDDSRTLGQIVTAIRKVLNKPNTAPTVDPRLLKQRARDRKDTLMGRRDRSGALRKDSEVATAGSSDVVY